MSQATLSRLFVLSLIVTFAFLSPLPLGAESGVRSVSAAPTALSGVKSVCPTGGDYNSLTNAIGYVRADMLDGPLVLELCASYASSYETYPLMVRAFPGSNVTNTVTIRPAADATGLSITSGAAQTIYLEDVSNVIFDGRPGGVGSSQELTITNTSTSGYAVYFSGSTGSTHNTLQYLTITGVGQSVVSFFPGSNDNVIDHCDVRGSVTATQYLILAQGGDISGNTVSNNRLHRFNRMAGGDSAGVFLNSGNTGWTITGNSIYQDEALTLAGTAQHQYGIYIAGGEGYVITDNIIGGSQPDGGGAAWTYAITNFIARFDGIYLNAGATTASSVQGNTIANFILDTDAVIGGWARVWSGITVASGAVNIISNIIGSGVITGSVQATGWSTDYDATVASYGIYAASSADVIIANNTIGAISVAGRASAGVEVAHAFVGIATSGAGNVTITGNTVGSLTTADSIQAGSASSKGYGQYVRGIESNSSGTAIITGNTVANLINYDSLGGQIAGIRTTAGANTIVSNTVRNLTASSGTGDTDHNAAVVGIAQASAGAGDQTVAQNVVHSLISTNSYSYPIACVYGIYFAAPVTATNQVSRNFVHSLSQTNTTGGTIAGIYAGGTATYQNNLVRLGMRRDWRCDHQTLHHLWHPAGRDR